ncbi:MAG: polynucleotide kinase-phosphatase [Anaerolineaceae bacterium]|nr:polynucleotide kinase-phosphatase [Anaerolineaceae bacterium]
MTEEKKNTIEIPELSIVAMVGSSSSGKSTFASKHFAPTEILSSDFFRSMVADDETDQSVTKDAFELLHSAAEKRLAHGRLTVVDATNLNPEARKKIIENARNQNVFAAAIVLNLPEKIIQERNQNRAERNLPARVIQRHYQDVKRSLKYLKKEGFRYVYVLNSEEEINNTEIVRTKLWNNLKDEHGPFDIIGDIHGCCSELEELLAKLGYLVVNGVWCHPEGRKAVFLGDFCDRGPRNSAVLKLVMNMVKNGTAIAVAGNHDVKLVKYLKGRDIQQTHGIDKTIEQIEADSESAQLKKDALEFLDGLLSHYVLDDGRLVVSHAGIKEEYIGRSSGRIREFCLYGETTGEMDSYGLPVRVDWAADYRGKPRIVYGHIADREVRELNNTLCIDTGCVYGGKLTAYRYPEEEIVSVDAWETYYTANNPLDEKAAQPDAVDMSDIPSADDVNHKMHITTGLIPSVDIGENNAAAALEAMSRCAADPHWLIYLPPTMSPCETSVQDDYLEYPQEAFEYFRKNGIDTVVCEKKHMGSRAVIVLCKEEKTAAERFGVKDDTRGIIYTRTGRRFFSDSETEKALLNRLDKVLMESGFWEDFATDWVCLDTELMPWSDKAQGLIRTQYAAAGNAGVNGLSAAVDALKKVCERQNKERDVDATTSGQNVKPSDLLVKYQEKLDDIRKYDDAYREYCWNVNSIDDYRIAPFHILAVEGQVFFDETHVWHMNTIRKYITGRDPIFMETPYLVVDVNDEERCKIGVQWWLEMTAAGGEGMVVKPETYTARSGGKLLQPAIKCRGREYLRIIYGPEYLEEGHLQRLKKRSLNHKRNLALKEFSLGYESLARFVRKEPLHKVHECAFGVLALESEPVDPRL